MRSLLIASLVLMVASVACAATPSQVPDSTLAVMGVSMQPMSDVQGTAIRGKAFVETISQTVTICNFYGAEIITNNTCVKATCTPVAVVTGAVVIGKITLPCTCISNVVAVGTIVINK
jgi:hypothetical protein